MIFKSRIEQAMGREASFSPGFGVSVSDAVQASCSAIPFFNRKIVQTDTGDQVELVDGGYCANNPTLYAITEAVKAFNIAPKAARGFGGNIKRLNGFGNCIKRGIVGTIPAID